MASTIDLILKGHFETLKEKAISETTHSRPELTLVATLNETLDYLKDDNSKKAKEIRSKLLDLLELTQGKQTISVNKKPMKKAGGKKVKRQDRKAM